VAKYRDRMREKGFRPVQIWVPDTRSPELLAAVTRDVAAMNVADVNDDTIEFFAAAAPELDSP
jgi:hypothetical protein